MGDALGIIASALAIVTSLIEMPKLLRRAPAGPERGAKRLDGAQRTLQLVLGTGAVLLIASATAYLIANANVEMVRATGQEGVPYAYEAVADEVDEFPRAVVWFAVGVRLRGDRSGDRLRGPQDQRRAAVLPGTVCPGDRVRVGRLRAAR